MAELDARGLGTSIGGLADALGITPRHLRRDLGERVGIGPKALHRVRRVLPCQRVIRAIEGGAKPSWAGLALSCGYFDQAHLIRAFAGLAPTSPRPAPPELRTGRLRSRRGEVLGRQEPSVPVFSPRGRSPP